MNRAGVYLRVVGGRPAGTCRDTFPLSRSSRVDSRGYAAVCLADKWVQEVSGPASQCPAGYARAGYSETPSSVAAGALVETRNGGARWVGGTAGAGWTGPVPLLAALRKAGLGTRFLRKWQLQQGLPVCSSGLFYS